MDKPADKILSDFDLDSLLDGDFGDESSAMQRDQLKVKIDDYIEPEESTNNTASAVSSNSSNDSNKNISANKDLNSKANVSPQQASNTTAANSQVKESGNTTTKNNIQEKAKAESRIDVGTSKAATATSANANATPTTNKTSIDSSKKQDIPQPASNPNAVTEVRETISQPQVPIDDGHSLADPMDRYPILVIDDDRWIQRIFNQYLSTWGFEHIGAQDAFTGLNLAVNNRPLLIFLDIVMPDVSGEVALKFLKAMDFVKDAPVIIISGNLNKQVLKNTYKDGAAGFISKPFSREILFDKIREVLDPKIFRRMLEDGKIDISLTKRKVFVPN